MVSAGLQRFGTTCVIDRNVHNVSVVTEDEDTLCVIVTIKPDKLAHNACPEWDLAVKNGMCPHFQKLYEVANVESMRPFTRFSQR